MPPLPIRAHTACQQRLKRLREEGVIEADVSIISPKAVGRSITMTVLVSLERERADIVDRSKAAIRSTKEVTIGCCVTSDADFILVVTARDMEDYEAFTRRFFYENHDINGFKREGGLYFSDRGGPFSKYISVAQLFLRRGEPEWVVLLRKAEAILTLLAMTAISADLNYTVLTWLFSRSSNSSRACSQCRSATSRAVLTSCRLIAS